MRDYGPTLHVPEIIEDLKRSKIPRLKALGAALERDIREEFGLTDDEPIGPHLSVLNVYGDELPFLEDEES